MHLNLNFHRIGIEPFYVIMQCEESDKLQILLQMTICSQYVSTFVDLNQIISCLDRSSRPEHRPNKSYHSSAKNCQRRKTGTILRRRPDKERAAGFAY